MSTFAALRALAALIIAPVIAWSLHSAFVSAQDLLHLTEPNWPFLLTSVYGNVIVGFVLAGVAAKFTPKLNKTFIRLTILGSILVGILMAVTSDYGIAVETGLVFALVAGTAGYGMRLRGFSEALTAD
ncbi:MAG: hypothetical protein ACE5FP_01265 [Gemmatimonadota bacterium]